MTGPAPIWLVVLVGLIVYLASRSKDEANPSLALIGEQLDHIRGVLIRMNSTLEEIAEQRKGAAK